MLLESLRKGGPAVEDGAAASKHPEPASPDASNNQHHNNNHSHLTSATNLNQSNMQRQEDLLAEARAEIVELQQRLQDVEDQAQADAEQAAAQYRDLELALEQERSRRMEAERDYSAHLKVSWLAVERSSLQFHSISPT